MELCGSRRHLKLLVLYVVYLSGYFNAIAAGDVCSSQQYRCNTCPTADSCSKMNVALGKPSQASSLYDNTVYNQVSGPACLAVNGNTGTEFKPINTNPLDPACVHMADGGDYTPYWEVDLGQQHIISSITVYGRQQTNINMLRKATVSVDDNLCFTFPSDYLQPLIVDISCNPPLTGRKVKIQKINDPILPSIAVCQVQVWGCKSGFYGTDCTNTCGHCSAGTCEPSSGVCPQGCVAGHQAPYCKDSRADPGRDNGCATDSATVAGAGAGAISAFVICLLLGIFFKTFRRCSQRSTQSPAASSSPSYRTSFIANCAKVTVQTISGNTTSEESV